jgi:asparagine synthase (glutamine-hydrolysing)
MCGFAGELAFEGAADAEAVARMTATMTDRGPDGVGVFSHGAVALGHRRLKIIDLSARGAQPMVDPQLGLALVFNGCVYNHRELRGELESLGYAFFSTSDTEVVMKAYHHWGTACVERFYGMFAFAIAERDSGRVILGRDRLGIKPLYIAQSDRALRFASTLPSLLAGGGVDTDIDPVALHHYLSWHSVVPAPHTILAGVRKLAPATVLTVEPDGTRRERVYWDPPHERVAERSEQEWREALLEALRVAVRRRMVSDVPVGVLLSGGLDSSLIVALLAEQGQRGLATFSIGFPDAGGREGDEFAFSDLVATEFGTEHHQIRVGTEELVGALPRAIAAMSEPMVSHDCVAFWLLAQAVSRERKVVQSGQGADEVLGGYSWYPPMLEAPGSGLDTYAAEFFDRDDAQLRELTGSVASSDVSRAFAAEWFARPGAGTPVDRALRLDSRVMLVDDPVKRVDNMTMAHGLEARTPFLDHQLVELAGAIPPELKLADGGKGILKAAARGVVPDAVIDREKGYFPVPALSHLEEPVLGMVRDALLAPAARERGLFRPEVVEAMLADPNSHRTNLDGSTLWQLGLLELWMQEHVG